MDPENSPAPEQPDEEPENNACGSRMIGVFELLLAAAIWLWIWIAYRTGIFITEKILLACPFITVLGLFTVIDSRLTFGIFDKSGQVNKGFKIAGGFIYTFAIILGLALRLIVFKDWQ